MTRKDFVKLAEALRLFNTRMTLDLHFDNTYDERVYQEAWEALLVRIEDVCSASNSNFDRDRFRQAVLLPWS